MQQILLPPCSLPADRTQPMQLTAVPVSQRSILLMPVHMSRSRSLHCLWAQSGEGPVWKHSRNASGYSALPEAGIPPGPMLGNSQKSSVLASWPGNSPCSVRLLHSTLPGHTSSSGGDNSFITLRDLVWIWYDSKK